MTVLVISIAAIVFLVSLYFSLKSRGYMKFYDKATGMRREFRYEVRRNASRMFKKNKIHFIIFSSISIAAVLFGVIYLIFIP